MQGKQKQSQAVAVIQAEIAASVARCQAAIATIKAQSLSDSLQVHSAGSADLDVGKPRGGL